MLGVLFVAASGGCDSGPPPTPEGKKVFEKDLAAEYPKDRAERLKKAKPTAHTQSVKLGNDKESTADVLFDTVTDPDDGSTFVSKIGLKVTKNSEYEIKVDSVGEPINLGTPEKVMMAIPFMVTATHKSGRQFAQSKITVQADGKIDQK